MIAEYERAQIAERTRRGKLHRARAARQAVMSGAPYGYRYVKKTDNGGRTGRSTRLEAQVVRDVFDRYVDRGRLDRGARPVADRPRRSRPGPARRGGTARRSGRCSATPPTAGRPRSGRRRPPSVTAARPHHPPARRAPRPPAHPPRPAGREVDADPGPAADHRGDVRARAGAPGRQRALRQAQHQGADAAARRARLPRVRLRLLPHLDPHQEQADQLLPLHRPGRLAAPRRQAVHQPPGPRR